MGRRDWIGLLTLKKCDASSAVNTKTQDFRVLCPRNAIVRCSSTMLKASKYLLSAMWAKLLLIL